MSAKRVVVTGLGCVSPIGNTTEETWAGIKEGRNGVAKITLFDASTYKVQIAAEVKKFDFTDISACAICVRDFLLFYHYFPGVGYSVVADAYHIHSCFRNVDIAAGCVQRSVSYFLTYCIEY